MRKLGVVLAIGLFLVAVSLLPVAKHAAAAVDVEVGDYWKYEAGADLEEMSASVTMKMKVTGTEGSGASEVYVITMTGSGDVSGSTGGLSMSGSVDYSGETKRLKSNFSLVSSDLDMIMSVKASGMSMKMTIGMLQTYSPALDDYIGDNNPGHGGTLISTSTVTSTTTAKIEVSGFPAQTETDTSTDLAVQTIHVALANATVTVPAGTFDCYKYTYNLDMGGMNESLTFYYSDEVGNFVKQEGMTTSVMIGALGNSELLSYSYGGKGSGGASSLFSGTNLLIIIVVIVAVLVVVSLVLLMRKRGKAVAPMQMPMQMQMPPLEMGDPPPPLREHDALGRLDKTPERMQALCPKAGEAQSLPSFAFFCMRLPLSFEVRPVALARNVLYALIVSRATSFPTVASIFVSMQRTFFLHCHATISLRAPIDETNLPSLSSTLPNASFMCALSFSGSMFSWCPLRTSYSCMVLLGQR